MLCIMGAGCVARNGGEGRRKRVAEHGLAQQIINTEFGTSSFERSSSFRHFPAANGNFRVHAACMYVYGVETAGVRLNRSVAR